MAQLQNTSITGSFTVGNIAGGGVGSIFFDPIENKLKVTLIGLNPGVWSIGGNLTTFRTSPGGAGDKDAGLAFGGNVYGLGTSNSTEEYNGTSWATGGSLPFGILNPGGLGTQNAALSVGGYHSGGYGAYNNQTYEYNGTSWSSGGTMSTLRAGPGAMGIQNAGLAFGGYGGGGYTTSEEYNGTSWSSGGVLNYGYNSGNGAGIQNQALALGESTYQVEEYDGATWTIASSRLTTYLNSPAAAGGQDNALSFGGYYGGSFLTTTEEYNGTSWSFGGNMNTGRYQLEGTGAQSSKALAFGGNTGPYSNATEEYTQTTFLKQGIVNIS
jgi:hypothetical protein